MSKFLAEQILSAVEETEVGADTDTIAAALGKTRQDLGDSFELLLKKEQLLGFAGYWMTPGQLETLWESMEETMQAAHEGEPEKPLLPRDRAKLPLTGKSLDRLMAAFAQQGRIRMFGNLIALSDHRPKVKEATKNLLDRVREEMEKGGLNTPSAAELAKELNVPPQAIDQIIRVGVEGGFLVEVADGIWYTQEGLDQIAMALKGCFENNLFSAAEVRDEFQTTRRYAIPLMEHFDNIGFTKRVDDRRKIVG